MYGEDRKRLPPGGKQYKVKEGETIKVEKLELAAGEKVKFDTLLVAETDGSQLKSAPLL